MVGSRRSERRNGTAAQIARRLGAMQARRTGAFRIVARLRRLLPSGLPIPDVSGKMPRRSIDREKGTFMTASRHAADIEAILSKRTANGGDFWASADGRLAVGDPFSTLTSLLILHELGVPRTHEGVRGALDLCLASWRDDGRYQVAPSGAIYPCHTAMAARTLCRFGYARDERLQQTFAHLLEIQYADGGWRCNKFPFGRGPETEFSNPGVTLMVLDAWRFREQTDMAPGLDRAVETLLDHWVTRQPTGPCHYGIGTLFMQVEYPFLRYNLFSYVYVLSFYARAAGDQRFLEALRIVETKLADDGRIVVERPNRKLAGLSFCAKGCPSDAATDRYREILRNLQVHRGEARERNNHR